MVLISVRSLHKNMFYVLDGLEYRVIEVRPSDAKRNMARFQAETAVGTVVQHEFPMEQELEVR